MSAWLDELRQALDVAPEVVAFFFRDDDGGWNDERLYELLDLFTRHSMPIDVAMIPAALTTGLATELRARIEAESNKVAIHQHGFSHQNHEPEGRRKCEFGITRESVLQLKDIEAGKRRLFDLLGPGVSPVFTPPWNRCAYVTGERLLQAGFRILSRDSTAEPLNLEGLLELPITVDWFARQKGVRLSPYKLGSALAASIKISAPVGIMFHHALMDEDERQRAGELMALLASHQKAQCYLMEQLAINLSQDIAARVSGQPSARPQFVLPALAQAEGK